MKKFTIFSSIFAATLMLSACGTSEEASTTEENTSEPKTEEMSSAYPMTVSPTVSESSGRDGETRVFKDVTFEEMPDRIAVFDYGFLDTLDALEVDGIVGVAQDSTLPTALEEYASDEYGNIGNLKTPNLEELAALEPDVIFISGRQSAFLEDLQEIAPVVYVGIDQNDYWNSFLKSVDIAAEMFDKAEEADEQIAELDTALEEIKGVSAEYDSALVSMYNEGKLSGFASNSSYGYIYNLYGFTPVTEDIESSTHGSNFGFEAILEFNPQVLFVIDRTAAVGGQSNIATDMENDIIKQTEAYKNNKIIYLDGALWYLGGGGLNSELTKINEIIDELE